MNLRKEAANITAYRLHHTKRKSLKMTMFKGSYLVGLSLMGLDGIFDTKVMLLWINLAQRQRKFAVESRQDFETRITTLLNKSPEVKCDRKS